MKTAIQTSDPKRPAGTGALVTNASSKSNGSDFIAAVATETTSPSQVTPDGIHENKIAGESSAGNFSTETPESELRLMADKTPLILIRCTRDLRYKFINRAGASLFRKTPEEVIGMYIRDVMDAQSFQTISPYIEKVLAGETVAYTADIQYPAGMRRMRVSYEPEHDSDGAVSGWIASIVDITDLVSTEQKLHRQAALIELSLEPIFEWDLNDGIIQWNAGAEKLYGYRRDEVLGKPSHLLLNTVYPCERSEFIGALKSDRFWSGELIHTTKSGETLIIESRQQLISSSGKEVVLETNRDITERRAGENRYRLLAAIGEIIRTNNDPLALQYEIAKAVGIYFEARRCLFNEIDLENDIETIHRDYCDHAKSVSGKHKISEYSSVTTENMRAGMTVVNSDSSTDPRTARLYRKIYEKTGERAYVAVPLTRNNIWVASLWVSLDRPRVWADAEVTLLEIIAERTWLAVEKLRNEARLRESEARFARFMKNLPGLAWIKDVEGRYVYANSAAVEAFQVPREKLYGRTDDEIFPPETAERFKFNDQLALADPVGLQRVESLEQADGVVHYSLVTKFPIDAAEGQTKLIGGMAIDITERMTAEKALRDSEDMRKLAQEAGNVGIFDWDMVRKRTYWSETMWTIYGENPSAAVPYGDVWDKSLHPYDRARVKLELEEILKSRLEQYRSEFRIVRKDGGVRWLEATARIVRDEDGKPVRMHGVNIDITERKETEEKLRLSENQLRLVTNALPALISYVDVSQRFRFVNRRYSEWFDETTEAIVGKKVRSVFGPSAYHTIEPKIKEAIAGRAVTFETPIKYRKAGYRYVSISYVPDIGIDGAVHGYFGLTHDLTELKRSEDLLRSSEERISLLVERIIDYAVFTLDSEGKINNWNKGAEIIYGYTAEEIVGKPVSSLYIPETATAGEPLEIMEVARRKGRVSEERWFLKKDGSRFFGASVLMSTYVGKELVGFAGITSDLTERKRQAEELQRAHDELEQRVKERTKELAETNRALLAEMEEREATEKQRIDLLNRLVTSQEFERRRIARDLHDQLGQRLTALRLKIASLKELSAHEPEIAARVNRLQEIAERLDSEVSFLAWELRPTALDDLGLVNAVGAFVTEWSRHYEISADFHAGQFSEYRPNLDVETHLYRITQEALNNITKHANATHVTVLLERRGQDIILIVEDDGTGFDYSESAIIGNSEKGLGLTGMRERASLVGGEVEIESACGRGTTIYVRVPIF